MSQNWTPWGAVVEGVVKIADDLVTTDKERIELELRGREIDQRTELAQIEVNKAAAQHPSRFVAGGRPAVIWVGVGGLAYQFLAYPLLVWLWTLAQGLGWLPGDMKPPPLLDIEALLTLVGVLLGVSGMRSYDKTKKVDTRRIE